MYVHRMTQGRHGRSWKSNATNVQMSPLKHVSAEFSLTDPNPQNILYPVSMYIYIYMDSILLVSHHFSLDLLQTHPPGNDHISHLRESRKIIDSKVPLKGDMLVPSRERCLEKKFVQKIFSQVVVNDGDSPMGFWAVKESQKKKQIQIWLVVSTHLKNIDQNGFIFPKSGWKSKNIWSFTTKKCLLWKKWASRNFIDPNPLCIQVTMGPAVTTLPKTHSFAPARLRRAWPQKERRKYSNHRFSGASC